MKNLKPFDVVVINHVGDGHYEEPFQVSEEACTFVGHM